MPEFDTFLTDLPTCPYCGHEYEDYSEFCVADTYQCEECGKDFRLDFETSITFATGKIKHDEEPREGE